MRKGEGDDLSGVAGVGQDLLVTGHARVEDDLAAGERLVASIGLAIPSENGMYGYLSEHHGFGQTELEAGEYAEDLAASMLEPESNDGLVTWNFFDQYIVKQWDPRFNPYPVYKMNTILPPE